MNRRPPAAQRPDHRAGDRRLPQPRERRRRLTRGARGAPRHVGKIGPLAKPANIVFTPEMPTTRSGKIMRRVFGDVADHRPLGDITTLADPTGVDDIKRRAADTDGEE